MENLKASERVTSAKKQDSSKCSSISISSGIAVSITSLNHDDKSKSSFKNGVEHTEECKHLLSSSALTSNQQKKIIFFLCKELSGQKKIYSQKLSKLTKINIQKGKEIQKLNLKLKDAKKVIKTFNELKQDPVSKDLRTSKLPNCLEKEHSILANKLDFLTKTILDLQLTQESYDELKDIATEIRRGLVNLSESTKILSSTPRKVQKKLAKLKKQYKQRLLKVEADEKKKIALFKENLCRELRRKFQKAEFRHAKLLNVLHETQNVNKLLVTQTQGLKKISQEKDEEIENTQRISSLANHQLTKSLSQKKFLEDRLANCEEQSKIFTEWSEKKKRLFEKRLLEKDVQIEELGRTVKSYEDMVIRMKDSVPLSSKHWPAFFKVLTKNISHLEKRVLHLETENDLLHEQVKSLVSNIQRMEEELSLKEKFISEFQNRAPSTVAFFRDKESLVRELRSQLNHRDLQLLGYAKELDRMTRINENFQRYLGNTSPVLPKLPVEEDCVQPRIK